MSDRARLALQAAPWSRALMLVAMILSVAACGATPSSGTPDAAASPLDQPAASSVPPAVPVPTRVPAGSDAARPVGATAFAGTWSAIVEAHDTAVIELLIANPLSEYDLVGDRLIGLLDRTHTQVAGLQPPDALADDVRALDTAMVETLRQLERIEPHGGATELASSFQRALDGWITTVLPIAQAIRDELGLPPVPSGDLQL